MMIRIGIEELALAPPARYRKKRLALLSNQASTNRLLHHSREVIEECYPGQLACLFSPQHGFFCEKQDNMIESDHMRDEKSGLPVYSLYGDRRKPDPAWLEKVEVLFVDLIDVGTRVYTFIWTVIHCLEVAATTGTQVVVLDRPNPIGGEMVEGNLLKPAWSSFVGLHTIPMRHGLTVGELAILCNREMGINADLTVIPANGWRREMLFPKLGFPWVFPSPNMPSATTALVYPGQVIWEGTNISEGRGTTLPFELFGAPFLHTGEVERAMRRYDLPGCVLRPLVFEPCFGKWAGQPCPGFQLHVTDPALFLPYRTALALLQTFLQMYPNDFIYKKPPYEYEFERLPLDLILGDQKIRLALENNEDLSELEASWQAELAEFEERRRAVFLYD